MQIFAVGDELTKPIIFPYSRLRRAYRKYCTKSMKSVANACLFKKIATIIYLGNCYTKHIFYKCYEKAQ